MSQIFASQMTRQRHILGLCPVIVEEDKLEFEGIGATLGVRDSPAQERDTDPKKKGMGVIRRKRFQH